jgi:undecaprenyl-diphosphatase
VSWRDATFVGAAQALALIPGFSRSGRRWAAGSSSGSRTRTRRASPSCSRRPIIGAAAALKLPELVGAPGDGVRGQALVGALCSALTAYLAVRFLMRFFETQTLVPFAIYCLCAGLATSIYFAVS